MAGWPVKDILGSSAKYGTPDEDLYGLLYFYVREKLVAFCDRNANKKMQFHIYCTDIAKLPSLIDKNLKFDRIEVANIVDQAYLGLEKTLETCSSLLKPPSVNPHAVLVALFMNAIEKAVRDLGPQYVYQEVVSALPKAAKFIPRPQNLDNYHPTFLRTSAAKVYFRDNDLLFQHYMKRVVDFDNAARQTKMKMKETNTVVEAWPHRFTKEFGQPGAQEAFDLLESSGCEGTERYVEWVRSE